MLAAGVMEYDGGSKRLLVNLVACITLGRVTSCKTVAVLVGTLDLVRWDFGGDYY